MTPSCTFVPNNHCVNLLCELFAKYRAGEPTAPTLIALREQLGQEEFSSFESDLGRLMRKGSASKAVEIILRQALLRKRADAAARGARPRITENKPSYRLRRAEKMLQDEARIARCE